MAQVQIRKQDTHKIDLDSRINQQYLAQIKPLLAQGLSEKEIGVQLGIRADELSRKLSAFRNTKEFQSWLYDAFFYLYPSMLKDHPVETFRTVSRLIGQAMASNPAVVEELARIEVSWLGPKDSYSSNSATVKDNCATMVVAEREESERDVLTGVTTNRKSQEFGTGVVAEDTSTSEGAQLTVQKLAVKGSDSDKESV